MGNAVTLETQRNAWKLLREKVWEQKEDRKVYHGHGYLQLKEPVLKFTTADRKKCVKVISFS